MNETMKTFGYPELTVKEYDNWVLLLRMNQVTIGSLVAIAKSGDTNLGSLSQDQWAEFSNVTSDIEALLRKTFSAEKFNYLALMMVDPNVHFHVIPRYSQAVSFNGREYTDTCWPGPTDLATIDVTESELQDILEELKSNINENH